MELLDNAGITINTTGVTSNTGTFKVQGTNNDVYDSMGNTLATQPTWFDLGVAVTLAGADITFEPNINQFPWRYLRIVFTAVGGSGNGTVEGIFKGKAI